MTRDETVALFLECEGKRGEARAAALAQGKSEDEARDIAHEAAKAHWNAWAEGLLAERKAMEADGRWVAEKDWRGSLEPKNAETSTWMEKAAASFSRCLFLVPGGEGTKETAGEEEKENTDGEPPVKSIQLEGSAADFSGFVFPAFASFGSATFTGDASFASATFTGDASFESATFKKDVFCQEARFSSPASFALCNFWRHATFAASRFEADASFEAIRGERGFNMAGAVFEVVPDFIQAHFEEAPRLDNLQVGRKLPQLKELDEEEHGKLNKPQRWHRQALEKSPAYRRVAEAVAKDSKLRDIPARWRALKRLAIQGHDTERELEFHARELRSQRFAEDWPLPLAFWRGRAWAGFFRFVFGCFYEWFSDFGRSLARPLLASWLVLIAAAAFFLSQTEALQRGLALQGASYVGGTVQTARHAVANPVPCYAPPPPVEVWRERWPWLHRNVTLPPPAAPGESHIDGLIEPFRGQTGARAEALHLAVRNAFVVLDGSGEAAHRTFGCLYGVELYGGSTPMAIVPSAVSTVSAAQKLFSALMIFLFGLALRNMLKMK